MIEVVTQLTDSQHRSTVDARPEDRLVMFFEHGIMPSSELSTNSRSHWAVRARHSKAWRDHAKMLGERALLEMANLHLSKSGRPLHCQLTYRIEFADKRKRDLDNLITRFKPYVDGLVDSGVLAEDSTGSISWGAHTCNTGSRFTRFAVHLQFEEGDQGELDT